MFDWLNKKPQTYAIGDIHGCARELKELLEKLPLRSDSTVVFLGDYIDRGNESRQVVDLILKLKKFCTVVTLKGNHEGMLLDFLDHPESAGAGLFVLNGGGATLASYGSGEGQFEIPEEHVKFYRELKIYHETENYFFVHAGVPDIPLKDLTIEKHEMHMLWMRAPFLQSEYDWGKVIVHGHSPVQKPDVRSNRINIDTGCIYNGQLTALELPSGRIFQVAKKDQSEASAVFRVAPGDRAVRFKGAFHVTINRGGQDIPFETLNYNQMGMLIREDLTDGKPATLVVGEEVVGRIGADQSLRSDFVGTVVRIETRDGTALYGIKMAAIDNDGEEFT